MLRAVMAVLVGVLMFTACKSAVKHKKAIIWDAQSPYSADPLEYDAFIHHIAFRAVLAPLVTQYKAGSYTGVIAESWSATDNYRVWTFRIRKGLRFENGQEISPQLVERSLKRAVYLLNKKGSQGGFAEIVEEANRLETPTSRISGITSKSDGTLTIRLTQSSPKFLDVISFGLYAIAHPSDYDSNTGAWLNPRKVTSSGHYRVGGWDEKIFVLELRSDFLPDLRHPNPILRIELVHDSSLRDQADLVSGSSIDPRPSSDHEFKGGALSGIQYVVCRSWALKDSPCFKVEDRKKLRNAFYRQMMTVGAPPTPSFFPLVMKGIEKLHYVPSEASVQFATQRPLKFAMSNGQSVFAKGFNESVGLLAKELNISAQGIPLPTATIMKEYDLGLPRYSADLYLLTTGVLIEDPDADIRFMVLSKEGICLPDSDGRLKAEVKRPKFDPQAVNRVLWDQAIVWPVTHFMSGFWAKNALDFSMINLSLPPTDFSWIGWQI